MMNTRAPQTETVGQQIRRWRTTRRMSQLQLALEAELSQRHLSFVESGRAMPSREMVLRISDVLELPLRHRNGLLLAAGLAPHYPERPVDDPALQPAMDVVQAILEAHMPNPALAIDRRWTMVRANDALGLFLEGIEDVALLEPPVNVLRLSLHPKGLAPRIINLREWRHHVLERLRRLNDGHADRELHLLEEELNAYPAGPAGQLGKAQPQEDIAMTLQLRVPDGELAFITTTTVFGTPLEVSLSELALETFFPADVTTRRFLQQRYR